MTIQDVFEAVGARAAGTIDDEELSALEHAACPGRGRLRRPVHGEHDGDRLRGDGHLSGGQRRGPCDGPAQGRGLRRRRAARDEPARARSAAERDHHKASLENAIAAIAATGGSTNGVLHLLAVAYEAGIELTLEDFDRISSQTPLLADLKPSGRFVAADLYRAGGVRLVAKRLLDAGALNEDEMTVTGRTIGDEAREAEETPGQEVVRPLENP